jgi:DHA1 family inner membrane transport protein
MTSVEPSYVSRGAYGRLLLLALGLFVVGTNAFVIAGVLPGIAATLHVTPAAVSYSITWYAVIVALASPAVSILFARVERSRLMAVGLLLIAIGTAISALALALPEFTAGRAIAALGGAALVPAATAAAPSVLPAHKRGRALAIAGLGFTLATAVGSPLGTALAGAGGWRLPLGMLAALALLLAVAVELLVRGLPVGAAISLGGRLATLRDSRVVLTLLATLLLTAGFNIVYIFSAVVTRDATGGSPASLAVLLLLYGLGGIIGTTAGGRLTDRFGSRIVVTIALALEAVALVLLVPAHGSFAETAAAFVVWGITAFAATVPVQHRLVSIDPATAGIALSWYSTAMYVGIALAPVVGAAALGGGGAAIAVAGASAAVLAVVAFQATFARRPAAPAIGRSCADGPGAPGRGEPIR